MIFFCDHFALLARTLFSAIYPMTTVLDGAWPKDKTKKNKVTTRTFENKKQLQKTKKKKNEKYQRRFAAASAGEQTISQGGALAICICNREIFAPFHTTTSSSCSSGLTSALTRLPGQLPRPITQHEYRLRQNKSASTIA